MSKLVLYTSDDGRTRLDGPGSVSHEAMKTIVTERYEEFDSKRRKQGAITADAEELNAIEAEARETDKALRKILKQLGV